MPPKTEGGGKPSVSNDAFLAACIKHAKEKVIVNFEALSKEVGMSVGGAANKYRAILKQLGEEGATWAGKDTTGEITPSTPSKSKATAGSKRKAAPKKEVEEKKPNIEVIIGEDNDASEEEKVEESPKKKAKATTSKAKPKAKSTAVKDEEESGEDVNAREQPTAKKTAIRSKGTTAKASTDDVENGSATGIAKKERKKAPPKTKEQKIKKEEPTDKEEDAEMEDGDVDGED